MSLSMFWELIYKREDPGPVKGQDILQHGPTIAAVES
jgi:hypothetical protein